MKKNKRFAFTLAEVLITLGIIGVVAALTIPTLINNYQTKSWNTAKSVFENKYTQALKIMNSQGVLSGYKTTEDFVEELSKHMKINKVCSNPIQCFEEKVLWGEEELDLKDLKTSANFGWKKWTETKALGVQFADGVTGVIAYNTKCKQNPYSNEVDVLDCAALLYDTSALANPNENGKDVHALNVHRLMNAGCAATVGNMCITKLGFQPSAVSKAECEELKKDGYGIQNCELDTDRWAGAVKTCGGVDYLPSVDQLKKLGADIYADGTFNKEKALAYGLYSTTVNMGNRLIFSKVENTFDKASGMIVYGDDLQGTYRINHYSNDGYDRASNYAVRTFCVD